jgi:hypothetical protein
MDAERERQLREREEIEKESSNDIIDKEKMPQVKEEIGKIENQMKKKDDEL